MLKTIDYNTLLKLTADDPGLSLVDFLADGGYVLVPTGMPAAAPGLGGANSGTANTAKANKTATAAAKPAAPGIFAPHPTLSDNTAEWEYASRELQPRGMSRAEALLRELYAADQENRRQNAVSKIGGQQQAVKPLVPSFYALKDSPLMDFAKREGSQAAKPIVPRFTALAAAKPAAPGIFAPHPTLSDNTAEWEYASRQLRDAQQRQQENAAQKEKAANSSLAMSRPAPQIGAPGYEKYDAALFELYHKQGVLPKEDSRKIAGYIAELEWRHPEDATAEKYIEAFAAIPTDTFSSKAANALKSIAYAIFGELDYGKDLTVEQAKRRRAYMNDPRYAALAAKKWLLENEGMGTPAEIAAIDQGLRALAAEFKAQEEPLANNELMRKAAMAQADAVYGTDSELGRFVTDTFISAGTFGANLALSFGNPAVALTLMGLESGAQAAYDIGRQGGTFAQQLQGGVASGVLAALIQKMPLAMVRKAWQIQGASGVQRFVKAFVKGALPESGVGFANTVAWNVADRVALGKEADMGKAEFWLDSLKQAFYASAVGAISGGLIAGVPAGFRGWGARVAAGTGGLEGELSTANGTNSIGKGAGNKIIKSADDVSYRQSSFDKAFSKHKGDFGSYPDGSNASKALFKNDINNLLENGLQKSGTYRATPGTHVYNPSTRQWAFYNADGSFNTAFKLSPDQYKYLIETGVVK